MKIIKQTKGRSHVVYKGVHYVVLDIGSAVWVLLAHEDGTVLVWNRTGDDIYTYGMSYEEVMENLPDLIDQRVKRT